jgi:hypothetical protein
MAGLKADKPASPVNNFVNAAIGIHVKNPGAFNALIFRVQFPYNVFGVIGYGDSILVSRVFDIDKRRRFFQDRESGMNFHK